ncbi:MAG: type IV pilus twitching motility protein PilT [Firmicutes bacterium]|nr:type IV pilus twitching motility protein PilT [Bacillota bacterium]
MLIQHLLEMVIAQNASDLHLTVGVPPVLRIDGHLTPIESEALTPEHTAELANQLFTPKLREKFNQDGQVDFSYSLPQRGRFRVNVYKQRGCTGLAIRLIPYRVPTLAELGLPEVLKTLTRRPKGLVLVTGPTGSGKSTTLAAMIEQINTERSGHIITLEDPIEYLHRHKKCVINQREIGLDTPSFAQGLRAALRQDPDVILVGEMRDLETIATAITAAETGHLVLATLHTVDAAQTIDRIIDVFPPNQQQQIRVQLAATLQGVVAQQLLPRADGRGRVAALEIMLVTPAIRNLIREGKTHQIISSLQTGGKLGMQTMEQALRNLVQSGLVTREEAMLRTNNLDALTSLLSPRPPF